MTFLTFLQFACAAIFITYMVAINQFKKEDKRNTGGRPQPDDYTFFPKKGQGLDKRELQHRFGAPAQKPGAVPAANTAPSTSNSNIPAAKQRKLDREAAKNNKP